MRAIFTVLLLFVLANIGDLFSKDNKINTYNIDTSSITIDFISEGIGYKDLIIIIRSDSAQRVSPIDSTKYLPNTSFLSAADSLKIDSLSFTGEKNQIIAFNSRDSIYGITNLEPNTYYIIDMYKKDTNGIEFVDSLRFTTLASKPELQIQGMSSSSVTTNSFRVNYYGAISQGMLVTISEKDNNVTPISGKGYKSSTEFGKGEEIAEGVFVVHSEYDSLSKMNITNLKAGTQYYLNAFALNGESLSCNYLTNLERNKNSNTRVTKLDTPVLLSIGSSEKSASYIGKWTKVEGATRYDVEVALDEGFLESDEYYGKMQLGDLDSFAFDELEIGVKYYIRVRAVNKITVSEFSNIKSIKK